MVTAGRTRDLGSITWPDSPPPAPTHPRVLGASSSPALRGPLPASLWLDRHLVPGHTQASPESGPPLPPLPGPRGPQPLSGASGCEKRRGHPEGKRREESGRGRGVGKRRRAVGAPGQAWELAFQEGPSAGRRWQEKWEESRPHGRGPGWLVRFARRRCRSIFVTSSPGPDGLGGEPPGAPRAPPGFRGTQGWVRSQCRCEAGLGAGSGKEPSRARATNRARAASPGPLAAPGSGRLRPRAHPPHPARVPTLRPAARPPAARAPRTRPHPRAPRTQGRGTGGPGTRAPALARHPRPGHGAAPAPAPHTRARSHRLPSLPADSSERVGVRTIPRGAHAGKGGGAPPSGRPCRPARGPPAAPLRPHSLWPRGDGGSGSGGAGAAGAGTPLPPPEAPLLPRLTPPVPRRPAPEPGPPAPRRCAAKGPRGTPLGPAWSVKRSPGAALPAGQPGWPSAGWPRWTGHTHLQAHSGVGRASPPRPAGSPALGSALRAGSCRTREGRGSTQAAGVAPGVEVTRGHLLPLLLHPIPWSPPHAHPSMNWRQHSLPRCLHCQGRGLSWNLVPLCSYPLNTPISPKTLRVLSPQGGWLEPGR